MREHEEKQTQEGDTSSDNVLTVDSLRDLSDMLTRSRAFLRCFKSLLRNSQMVAVQIERSIPTPIRD